MEIAGKDEKKGYLYFYASPENATQRYLFRTKLDGTGKAERFSPANQPGAPRIRHFTRRTVGVSFLFARGCGAGFRFGGYERPETAAPRRRQRGAGESDGADDCRVAHGIFQGEPRKRPDARRLDAEAAKLRSGQKISDAGVCVRRTGRADGAGFVGRVEFRFSPHRGAGRVHRGEF